MQLCQQGVTALTSPLVSHSHRSRVRGAAQLILLQAECPEWPRLSRSVANAVALRFLYRRSALAEALFGSVTNAVAHHCEKPVIVIHCNTPAV